MITAAATVNDVNVTKDQLSWTAGLLNVHEHPVVGFWLLYAAVVLMCIVVFNLGFARKLPLLKNVIVYAALFIGALPLTIFAIGMAVVESLIAAAIVLGIYKIRLKRHKQEQESQGSVT
ncbi:YlaH-like family protein [Alteribacillus bidgolensis]|uniref:YlaH-like protein n=1 Tax=Alteribacillus bidgolensis TaxID=930129 RepID=A0A1G8G3N5_9BACI|nr:YlaH-like family protein [Alteribacillus bidgolensis]SDH88890.1 YlaH-like protein [Alteribacillus bidgolensis]